ncbi:MAG TPA: hypothetical protein ENI70_00160, partial [Candidatus Peregrinibacteria bacterium]|nr:hypothetical protein [Candidatus Peregrinibacteria bacterium]
MPKKKEDKITVLFSFYTHSFSRILYDESHESFQRGGVVVFVPEKDEEELGMVVSIGKKSQEDAEIKKKGKIVRKATARDLQKLESSTERAKEVLKACRESATRHSLDMYFFSAAYSLDGAKIYINFTADERIDFRELVKDIASTFKKKIHLQQVGPRDRARATGGFGKCGRHICCQNFLVSTLHSVVMD